MESSGQRDLRLALAGLQAGCLGSLLMIGWWLLGELVQRRSLWMVPNLLATTFYGERAYRSGFIVPTWSGLAFPLAVYCAAGVVFALSGRERKGGWGLLLVGAAAGLALNWLFFGVALKRLNPLVGLYSPDRLIAVSHLLYGVALVTYPGFARDLSGTSASSPTGTDPSGSGTGGPLITQPAPAQPPVEPATSVPEPTGSGTADSGTAASGTAGSDDDVGRSVPQGPEDTRTGSVPL